jgi:chromosome segregation ATPase
MRDQQGVTVEYEDALWRFVDVPNLERRRQDAQDAVARTDQKIELMESHLTGAKEARAEADREVEAATNALEAAHARTAEVPEELAARAKADVDQRNRVRSAVVKAMAGAAEATGEANGVN